MMRKKLTIDYSVLNFTGKINKERPWRNSEWFWLANCKRDIKFVHQQL